jgi:hypothetical protein
VCVCVCVCSYGVCMRVSLSEGACNTRPVLHTHTLETACACGQPCQPLKHENNNFFHYKCAFVYQELGHHLKPCEYSFY